MLIVEDAAGTVPDELGAMEEVALFMQHLNMPALTAVAQEYVANCQGLGGTAEQCADPVWAVGAVSGTQTNTVLVNGMG